MVEIKFLQLLYPPQLRPLFIPNLLRLLSLLTLILTLQLHTFFILQMTTHMLSVVTRQLTFLLHSSLTLYLTLQALSSLTLQMTVQVLSVLTRQTFSGLRSSPFNKMLN